MLSHSEARSAEEPAVACSATNPAPSPRSPTLHPNPPERTHPKPRKRHCETNCNHHPAHPNPPGLVLRILFCCGKPATSRHHQENQPRNLQPQLMQHPSQGPRHRSSGLSRGPHHPAALDLLRGHAPHHPDLSCPRNLAHGLDFNSLQRYNDASLPSRSNPLAAAGI